MSISPSLESDRDSHWPGLVKSMCWPCHLSPRPLSATIRNLWKRFDCVRSVSLRLQILWVHGSSLTSPRASRESLLLGHKKPSSGMRTWQVLRQSRKKALLNVTLNWRPGTAWDVSNWTALDLDLLNLRFWYGLVVCRVILKSNAKWRGKELLFSHAYITAFGLLQQCWSHIH